MERWHPSSGPVWARNGTQPLAEIQDDRNWFSLPLDGATRLMLFRLCDTCVSALCTDPDQAVPLSLTAVGAAGYHGVRLTARIFGKEPLPPYRRAIPINRSDFAHRSFAQGKKRPVGWLQG